MGSLESAGDRRHQQGNDGWGGEGDESWWDWSWRPRELLGPVRGVGVWETGRALRQGDVGRWLVGGLVGELWQRETYSFYYLLALTETGFL